MGPSLTPARTPWWANAVIYQIYPRSFQDSDGDGVGDLPGVTRRLEHVRWLGADAVWLSPFYPSPMADGGYDVSDYTDVDPRYGSLADFDRMLRRAHEVGLRVIVDLVANHTSIEHPWFRDHPDWYVWSDDVPGNNWVAAFGGPAWSFDSRRGRWYLHSFYPEQPDLDWRNPEVVAAMHGVVRFWRNRGVDGFRIDAADRLGKDPELRDDPPATAPPAFPENEQYAKLAHGHSKGNPSVKAALQAMRDAAGDAFLVGEAYVPAADYERYLGPVDVMFAFELLWAEWNVTALRRAIERALEQGGVAWATSNHDVPRAATRLGPNRARTAALLLLTLPGPAFVYQGEEIGMRDGDPADPPLDRAGRDGARHPMQWEPDPLGGFTTGRPWLPLSDPLQTSVAGQRGDPNSMLALYRRLIALRREMKGRLEWLESPEETLSFRRGRHRILLNLSTDPLELPAGNAVVVRTDGQDGATLPPDSGAILA